MAQKLFPVPGDFPVLTVAVQEEFLRQEKGCSILRLSADLIPANPVIFVRLCALLPDEAKSMGINKFLFAGFNGFIAMNGYLLVVSETAVISFSFNTNYFFYTAPFLGKQQKWNLGG